MKISSIWHQRHRLQVFSLAALLIVCLTLIGCSPSAQSANNTQQPDGKLKEQVLQIIRENPEVILESVQAYQQQQQDQLRSARQSFLQQVKTNPKAAIADSPTTGSPSQKLVLIEFSDFQCPFCSRAHNTVNQFMAKHQDKVTLAFKHFPLIKIHPQALPAAKAAWAAQQQGKFWEYHNALFEQQKQLSEELYGAIAKNLNLNLEKFNNDRNSPAAEAAIEKDIQIAQTLGIDGTPFFILNGETFSGAVELSEMETILAKVSK
ncbi:thioredoxin domain-containing protein [Kamptonema sp. UHCC 0994]|uniref:DsbA family protein n=1 Tax=Kamptonema sp. UHCC 0994 TaxID=3031329 RepID=UPI0023BA2A6F|nr:thioredoxin domain-containing protein [Kamptonema sp. UHCC 0994]MDF0552232.1 thioredoxin domain-containing protein [Kamptonema sp. UHCC 0994]